MTHIADYWTSGALPERPCVAFERSLSRFDFSDEANAAALDAIIQRWGEIMPSLQQCRQLILAPAFARMSITPAGISAGLIVSAPASARAPVSLGWVERRWRGDGALAAKIRVSAHLDATGQLFWDFGVAGRNAPPLSSLRNCISAASLMARKYGALLDLTPSHQKAAWLALRLGGRPTDRARYLEALRSGRWADISAERLAYA